MQEAAKEQREKAARVWAEDYCARVCKPFAARPQRWVVDICAGLYAGVLEKCADILDGYSDMAARQEKIFDMQDVAASMVRYTINDMTTINAEREAKGQRKITHKDRLIKQAVARCVASVGDVPRILAASGDRCFFTVGIFARHGDYFKELLRRDFTRGKDGYKRTQWAGLGKTRIHAIIKEKRGALDERIEKAKADRAAMHQNATDAFRRYHKKVARKQTEKGDSHTLREISNMFCCYMLGADKPRD